MIARHYGRAYPRQFIRQLCEQDRQGTSFATLGRAAEHLGFRTLAVRLSFDDLKEKAPLPCIVYWAEAHFVVVYRITKKRVYVADPSAGRLTYTREEFEKLWLTGSAAEEDWGFVLLLEPSQSLLPDDIAGARRPDSAYIVRPLWNEFRRHLTPLAGGAVLLLLIQLAAPFLGASMVDGGILAGDLSFIHVALVAQGVLFLSRLGVEALQGCLVSYVGLRVEIQMVANFLLKLTRLPLRFFDGRRIGELMQRINDHQRIQQLLTESLSAMLLATLSLGVFSIFLAMLRPGLFLIFALGSTAYLAFCALFFRQQRMLNYKQFQLSARNQGLIVELLAGMQEIKLNNAERQRRWQWEAAQQAFFRTQVRTHFLARAQGSGGAAINELKNLIITLLVASDVVSGRMSFGTMVAVQTVLGQLSLPLNQIALLICQSHEALMSYQRAREIHALQEEEEACTGLLPARDSDIVLSRVSFGYGGTVARPVLRDVSLTLPSGKTTAVVGRSGSGKTTLLRLLLKFHEPGAGEIRLGAQRLGDISHYHWRDRCGIVMQDGYIFSDTVLNNIAVGDEHPRVERVVEVARVAQIGPFIESLPLGYETVIGRDGIGISRGQAQRILIARALYKDPEFLFFDEATSALDAETERAIVTGLKEATRGKTALIIAHRMSTVRHADQIVVLDGGRIVECGSHEELVASRAFYFELVRNQLELGQ